MNPRFSVVLPAHNRADVIGRATAGVLAQTFGDLEVVVVDDGSTDDTVAAARAVADQRVRIVRQEHAGFGVAMLSGISRSTGQWCLVLEPDDEVAPGWLARLGRLIDSTGAGLVSCGGDQRHPDGSLTTVTPQVVDPSLPATSACFRPGAFACPRELLVEVTAAMPRGEQLTLDSLGKSLTAAAVSHGTPMIATPERLVQWNERVDEPVPIGNELRLRWALQAIDAVARTPIPDSDQLARYATIGGVAAARLRERCEARRLFRLARQVSPRVAKHWARWFVALVPPVADQVWESNPASDGGGDRDTASTADTASTGTASPAQCGEPPVGRSETPGSGDHEPGSTAEVDSGAAGAALSVSRSAQ